jgi:DNA-binding NarL/FixJ family response regulator
VKQVKKAAPAVPAGTRVVLVEDHPIVRLGLTEFLEHAGLDVLETVGTADEGRRAVTERRPEVAVIDQRLPDGLGMDLCHDLRTRAPDVVTIIYSSAISPADREEALLRGADEVVSKTIDGRDLLAAIARGLAGPAEGVIAG